MSISPKINNIKSIPYSKIEYKKSDLVYFDRNSKITNFVMKNENKDLIQNSVSSGIYIIDSSDKDENGVSI